jgi:NAD(P)-dependent dehydrogenase (short-subunit alcohol dehydrogenase family)
MLKDKVAIVTGAGRGIGKQIAIHLAAAGAHVVVNYAHSEAAALETLAEIKGSNHSAIAIKADISKLSEINELVEKTIKAFGKIDILVNNAGVDPREEFFDIDEDFWNRVVDTNMKGTFFCMQACAREMMKLGKGKIINITSVHASLTMPRYSVYASTKGAINAMTRQIAQDLAKYNIQVNAIAPGVIEVEKNYTDPLHDREHFGRLIPQGRIGLPQDVAPMVVFLASDQTEFITGQVITIDGGTSTKLFVF